MNISWIGVSAGVTALYEAINFIAFEF